MSKKKFQDIFWFAPKSNIKAGEGLDEGRFPFYTSSQVLSKFVNTEQHFDEALIFGTGGSASIHYADEPFSTSTDCLVAIATDKNFNTKFVYYYLFGNIQILERGFKGAGLKHISKSYIQNIDIPIYDLETQNKIVATLDKATVLLQKRQETIDLLDDLLKAQFLDMFGDPLSIKSNWEKKTISEFGDSRLGKMLDRKKITGKNLKPYLRNTNVKWFKFDLNELLEMDFDKKEQEEFELRNGDILMCEGGEIGRCAIWRDNLEDCYFQKALHRIRLNTKIIIPEFFVYQFWIFTTSGGLQRFMGGATISHLTGENLKKLILPVPPIKMQQKFKVGLDKINTLKGLLEKEKERLVYFFNSILQDSFIGKLKLNISAELDSLLKEVELRKPTNDLINIVTNEEYLTSLVNRLNAQEFENQDLYDKAKHVAFQLLKQEERLTQEYDKKSKSLKLVLK